MSTPEKKQTAVEWLEEQYRPKGYITSEEFQQALAMERQQIEKAVDHTQNVLIVNDIVVATLGEDGTLGQKYYTETYGK